MQFADLVNNIRIGVIGMGYVGLPLAVEFGKKYPVVGFDIKHDRVAELKRGEDSTLEVEPAELQAVQLLEFTDAPEELRHCNVSSSPFPRLSLVKQPGSGQYDAIVLAVGHRQFAEMGAENIRALGKPDHVLYDVKYLLPACLPARLTRGSRSLSDLAATNS